MENITPFLSDPDTEPHIVIQDDRTVVVPDELKEIAVQYDHNIETVYFDCPRYWDGNDMSKMIIRINFERADGYGDSYQCKNVTVDDSDENIMHFEWKISRNVSEGPGTLKFTVCAIKTDASAIGNELLHWSSKICSDVKVLPGLDFEEHILSQHPDIIAAAQEVTQKAIEATEKTNQQYEDMKKQAAIIGDGNVGTAVGAESTVPAVDGAGIIRKFPGKTYQVKTNGYQLFDASKFPTKTQGGATLTNNNDGSFTISGSGNLSSHFSEAKYSLTQEEAKKIIKVGRIYVKNAIDLGIYFELQIKSSLKSLFVRTEQYVDITQEVYDSITQVNFIFFGKSGSSIPNKTVKPMVYQDGDGTWEPYTGGKPGPNPEYPLKVQGVGDSEDGKYAAIAKSRTMQLFDASKLPTKTQGGATVTNNSDGSFTVSGSGTLTQSFSSFYTDSDFKKWLKVGNITAKINEFKRPYFLLTAYAGGKAVFTLTPSSSNGYKSSHYITEDEFESLTNVTYGFTGNSGDEILTGTVKPMIYQDGDGTWQRFASSEARIPLSQPMYDGDYAYIKDGKLWVHRENGVAVFDGTESTNWSKNNSMNGFYQFTNTLSKTENAKGTLDINTGGVFSNVGVVKQLDTETKKGGFWIYNGTTAVIVIKSDLLSDYSSDALKTWLKSNPVTVVYKLLTPTEEKITSAEPYTLRTYTPQTRIWTPDELKPEIEVDIPKNLAGGYATDGYAQAMKNQAATAEQEAIKARLLSLEQLAIKEV